MTTAIDLKSGKKLITKWSYTNSENELVVVEMVHIITLVTEKRVTMVRDKGSSRKSATGRNLSTEWISVKKLLEDINNGKTSLQ